jgi:hypothetical protein
MEVLMRPFVAVLALAALVGCTREPTPLSLTGEQLMIHSLVLAGSETVHVHLARALSDPIRDPDLPGGFVFSRPVSGADVRLIQGQTTVTLSEAPPGFPPCALTPTSGGQDPTQAEAGCYAARVPGGIRGGDQYRLEVRLGAAGSAEGQATVPDVPQFTGGDGRTRHSLVFGPGFWGGGAAVAIPVRYQLPARVNGVRVGIQLDEVFHGGRQVPEATCYPFGGDPLVRRSAATDSIRLELHGVYCRRDSGARVEEFAPDSVLGRVVLTGFDSTYVRYAEAAQQRSAEGSRLRAGVSGALGVFAGGSTVTRPITLIRSPGGQR